MFPASALLGTKDSGTGRRRSSPGHGTPQALIFQDESLVVHQELGCEVALGVPVPVLCKPGVGLANGANIEVGPGQPGNLDFDLVADAEVESTDGQGVGGGSKTEIDVHTVPVLRRARLR